MHPFICTLLNDLHNNPGFCELLKQTNQT
jgi:hypothetical protein